MSPEVLGVSTDHRPRIPGQHDENFDLSKLKLGVTPSRYGTSLRIKPGYSQSLTSSGLKRKYCKN